MVVSKPILELNFEARAPCPAAKSSLSRTACKRRVSSSTLDTMNNDALLYPEGMGILCALRLQRSNPSIERTHNGGAQCLAPSMVVPPLCAAHVKR